MQLNPTKKKKKKEEEIISVEIMPTYMFRQTVLVLILGKVGDVLRSFKSCHQAHPDVAECFVRPVPLPARRRRQSLGCIDTYLQKK